MKYAENIFHFSVASLFLFIHVNKNTRNSVGKNIAIHLFWGTLCISCGI